MSSTLLWLNQMRRWQGTNNNSQHALQQLYKFVSEKVFTISAGVHTAMVKTSVDSQSLFSTTIQKVFVKGTVSGSTWFEPDLSPAIQLA